MFESESSKSKLLQEIINILDKENKDLQIQLAEKIKIEYKTDWGLIGLAVGITMFIVSATYTGLYLWLK